MSTPLSQDVLAQLFTDAHSIHQFTDQPVTNDTLHQLYDLLKWGPTAFNAQPGRYVFVRSKEAKQRLAPALAAGNLDKTLAAPVTVIIAQDSEFHEQLPTQFPGYDARSLFINNPGLISPTAFRNSSLQGAYLIIAARALGLDAGAMSGFDAAKLDAEFFPDGKWKSNFLINLGYAAPGAGFPRGPRLPFDDAARIL